MKLGEKSFVCLALFSLAIVAQADQPAPLGEATLSPEQFNKATSRSSHPKIHKLPGH